MRLLSWNVAGRTKVVQQQIDAVCGRDPDVVALQEVRPSAWPAWADGLRRRGFAHLAFSHDLARAVGREPALTTGVAIASRVPLVTSPPRAELPYPDSLLSVRAAFAAGPVDFHVAHLPPGSSKQHGERKLQTFDVIYDTLAIDTDVLRVLCGDFNSPKEEESNGTVHCHSKVGDDWYMREWMVMAGLAYFGLADVFRDCNGWDVEAWSHAKPEYGDWKRRFDHIFAAEGLGQRGCRYHTDWIGMGLSDHAPIEADFDHDAAPGRSGCGPLLGSAAPAGGRRLYVAGAWYDAGRARFLFDVPDSDGFDFPDPDEPFDPNDWPYLVRCRHDDEARDRATHEARARRLFESTEAPMKFKWVDFPLDE